MKRGIFIYFQKMDFVENHASFEMKTIDGAGRGQ